MSKGDFYSRQIILKDIGDEGQKKIFNSKVLIVGAGGLGNPVASYLAAAGIGEITILDFDKIEESNLNRQILFSPNEIGYNKANVLADKIKKQNPYIKISSLVEKIIPENCEETLKGFDIIVDCCDNFSTKFLLHDVCWFLKKNLVQASIYQYEGQIQVFNYSENINQGCLRCLWPSKPSQSCTGTCEEAGVVGAVAGTLGSIQAMEVIKIILNLGQSSINTTKTFNLLDFSIQKLKWKQNDQCPLCSKENGKKNENLNQILDDNNRAMEKFELINIDYNMTLVDLREEDERHENSLIVDSIHRPYSQFNDWKSEINENQDYLFICSKGIRSFNVVEILREEKITNSYSLHKGLEGGIQYPPHNL